jgi:hypothetical protein
MSNPLYIFITHRNNLNNCYNRIQYMMDNLNLDYLVVQGGFIKDNYDENTKILNLNCNDGYIGLPEKVMKTYHFLISNSRFNQYTHFIKCDDDIEVIQKFENIEDDYMGKVQWVEGNRQWHIGRTNTFWDQIPYLGEYKPWCLGGNGYIVSRRALEKITPNHDYLKHIYEDLYIGILMNKIGVTPKNINIKDYMVSPNH